jgi:hypothetical protein
MVGKDRVMVTPVLAHGMGHMLSLFPLFMIGAAIFVILIAMRDGSNKKTNTRTIPINPLSRQMHAATRRRSRSTGPSTEGPSSEKTFRRFGAPRLRVMEGEAEGTRPAIPRRFEPPPPSRRKTG